MERDKFCPIRNRHVCQARGAVEQREFRGGAARVKRFAKDRGVAPGLLGFISGARRPESARADAQWLKQSFAHQVFPRTTGEVFQHCPRENVADIGIPVFGVRRDSWRARKGLPRDFQALLRQGSQRCSRGPPHQLVKHLS